MELNALFHRRQLLRLSAFLVALVCNRFLESTRGTRLRYALGMLRGSDSPSLFLTINTSLRLLADDMHVIGDPLAPRIRYDASPLDRKLVKPTNNLSPIAPPISLHVCLHAWVNRAQPCHSLTFPASKQLFRRKYRVFFLFIRLTSSFAHVLLPRCRGRVIELIFMFSCHTTVTGSSYM